MNNKPVDNELEELLERYFQARLTEPEEKHLYTRQAKARLLQWGKRQRLDEAKRMEYTVVKTIESTGKGADWRQTIEMYVKLREVELQASLKDGGDRNKCLDCGKKLPNDYPFTYCDNDWEKHHPNPTKETK